MITNILKCVILTLVLSESKYSTLGSIAGVTYMDHFDFESRYRNAHECDPIFWHPLHLPEKCASMYEKLIRSRIAKQGPVRVLKPKDEKLIFHIYPSEQKIHTVLDEPTYPAYVMGAYGDELRSEEEKSDEEYYEEIDTEITYNTEVVNSHLSPYEKMLNLMREDVKNMPSQPNIVAIPNLGVAAVYRQPISQRSQDAITKLASAYVVKQIPEHDNHNSRDKYQIKIVKDGKIIKPKSNLRSGKHRHKSRKNKKLKIFHPELMGTATERNGKVFRKKIVKDHLIFAYEEKKVN